MTDKATIQPKSKPGKTTISISGETSERLEIYCRTNGILRKDFVSLSLDYFERTGFDLKSNALDYSPLEKIIGELNDVKTTMQANNEGTEAVRQLIQVVQEQAAKQLPAPDLIAHTAEEKPELKPKSKNRKKKSREYKKRILDYVTKSTIFKATKKEHIGNFVEYVTNKNNRKNKSEYRTIISIIKIYENKTFLGSTCIASMLIQFYRL